MYKIKSVTFKDHPILGNLHLDFCDLSGNAVDTVIIAGENGTGKSTVLDLLYSAVCFSSKYEMTMIVEVDGRTETLHYFWYETGKTFYVDDGHGRGHYQGSDQVKARYPFHAIFSDVDINFKSNAIQTVTSNELDQEKSNQRSSSDLPTQIKQLIVDIQASDAADTDASYKKAIEESTGIDSIVPGQRLIRFTTAFNKMFDSLTYSKVINKHDRKSIMFKKNENQIDIDALSSGEKQIVYRGCFLLKDKDSLNGAFAFIDEPEISLHPEWQKKILEYYKGIFTDENGKQTSQLFVVTHSPFIIHNSNRSNDKVIVLKRDNAGKIIVLDKPEYYICESTAQVKDAFNIDDFEADTEKSVVYLEGRTDEKYFKKAAEVFGYTDLPFEFQWVGHLQKNGQEEFTGSSSLNQAVSFMKGRKPGKPQVFLYDCDTNKADTNKDNIIILAIPKYEHAGNMNIGIENALVLNGINLENFYSYHTNPGKKYGEETTTKQFEKMWLCDYICNDLETEEQKTILMNLKTVIERIMNIFETDGETQQ